MRYFDSCHANGRLRVELFTDKGDEILKNIREMLNWFVVLIKIYLLPTSYAMRCTQDDLARATIDASFDGDEGFFDHFSEALKEARVVEVNCAYPVTGEEYLIDVRIKFTFSDDHKTKWRTFKFTYNCEKEKVFAHDEVVKRRESV